VSEESESESELDDALYGKMTEERGEGPGSDQSTGTESAIDGRDKGVSMSVRGTDGRRHAAERWTADIEKSWPAKSAQKTA
jgi:hypothetical protein